MKVFEVDCSDPPEEQELVEKEVDITPNTSNIPIGKEISETIKEMQDRINALEQSQKRDNR